MVTSVDKFIVAAVGLAITLGLVDSELGEIISGTATALAVYLWPNAE